MNTTPREKSPNSHREEQGIKAVAAQPAGKVPLYLDSLDQRLDILMGTLRTMCQKISPVLSENQPSEAETAMPAQDPNLSTIASRLSHMDDQVLRMIKEVAYVTERIEL